MKLNRKDSNNTQKQQGVLSKSLVIQDIDYNETGEFVSIACNNGFFQYNIFNVKLIYCKKDIQYKLAKISSSAEVICLVKKFNPDVNNSKNIEKVLYFYDINNYAKLNKLQFQSKILSVKINKVRTLVQTASGKLHLQNTKNQSLLNILECKTGIYDLSNNQQPIVCQANLEKQLQITLRIYDTFNLQLMLSIEKPHYSGLKYIKISGNGELIATTSNKGSVIRIWQIKTGKKLYELKANISNIITINFDLDSKYIAVNSDKGLLQLFALKNQNTTKSGFKNKLSELINKVLNDQDKKQLERFANIKLHLNNCKNCTFICDKPEQIIIISNEGVIQNIKYTIDGLIKITKKENLFDKSSLNLQKEEVSQKEISSPYYARRTNKTLTNNDYKLVHDDVKFQESNDSFCSLDDTKAAQRSDEEILYF